MNLNLNLQTSFGRVLFRQEEDAPKLILANLSGEHRLSTIMEGTNDERIPVCKPCLATDTKVPIKVGVPLVGLPVLDVAIKDFFFGYTRAEITDLEYRFHRGRNLDADWDFPDTPLLVSINCVGAVFTHNGKHLVGVHIITEKTGNKAHVLSVYSKTSFLGNPRRIYLSISFV